MARPRKTQQTSQAYTETLSEQELMDILQFAMQVYNTDPLGFFTPNMNNRNIIDLNNNPLVPTKDRVKNALSDYKNCLNLFIYGEEETKVNRIMEKYNLSEAKALDMILKKDKQRQSYYNYYSSKKWGRADSYDLCINSSKFGIEGTVQLIINTVDNLEK